MARPSLLSVLWVPATAVVLAVGGCGGGAVEEASDANVAQPADEGEPPATDDGGDGTDGATDDGAADDGAADDGGDGGDQGNAGGPGRDPGDGGDVDVEAQGNAGAPGDVAVFEERGVSYAEFRDGSAQRVCVEQGKCTLAPPYDPEGVYSDPAECAIESMDYSTGTRTNADGDLVFLEGATVTVTVSCLRFTDPDGDGVPGTSEEGTDGTEEGTDGTEEGTDGTEEGTEGTEGTGDEGTGDSGGSEGGGSEGDGSDGSTEELPDDGTEG
jgi:hypothetical protein